jgi:hypothetical protein
MLLLWLVFFVAVKMVAARERIFVERVEPQTVDEFGGARVVISGRHFPWFARGVTVLVGKTLECSDVRIVQPFHSLSCIMPKCLHCGEMDLKLMLDEKAAALLSAGPSAGKAKAKSLGRKTSPEINAIKVTYSNRCYSGNPPLLPRKYSAAENCTTCSWIVSGALNIVGDIVSNQAIRQALREVCQTQHITFAGRVTETYCKIDVSAACAMLYHTSADQLADAMWDRWDDSYLFGGLPQTACAAIGRCELELPTRSSF